jgi:hypothetical protein
MRVCESGYKKLVRGKGRGQDKREGGGKARPTILGLQLSTFGLDYLCDTH